MFKLRIWLLFSLTFIYLLNAQNLEKIGSWDSRGYVSDCWGYDAPDGRFYAIAGTMSGTSVLDVTNPSEIKEVGFVSGPGSIWRDIKIYKHYAYTTNETEDLAIIDLSNVPESIRHVKDMDIQNFHNLFIDTTNAYMYLCNASGNGQTQVYSLEDPEDPQYVSQFGTETHDIYVRDGVAYTAEGRNRTVGFYNISNPKSPSLIKKHIIPNAGYVHNVWLSKNGDFMITTEETGGKTIKIWDISNLSNIEKVSEYLGPSQLAHNAQVEGDYAYISHYESGVAVLDLHDPTKAAVVGLYDTYPASNSPNFNGTWGVYPHSKSGNIYVSGEAHGLIVLKFNGARASYLNGTIFDKESGTPLQNAYVHFEGFATTIITDQDGKYGLGSGLSESAIIKISAYGYKTVSQQVALPSGETHVMDFKLEKISKTDVRIVVKDKQGLSIENASASFTLTSTLLNEDENFYGISDENGVIEFSDLNISYGEIVNYVDLTISAPFPLATYEQTALSFEEKETNNLEINLIKADLLVINGDPNSNYGNYIKESVNNIGKIEYLYNLESKANLPSVKSIKELNESYLIWITGDAEENVLSQAEIDTIKAYLMAGGNVILSGQNIAEYLANTSNPFLQDWLHVNYLENTDSNILSGNLHVISNEVPIVGLYSHNGANNQYSPDLLELDGSKLAKPIFGYYNLNDSYSAVGIEYPNYNSKIFFAGFGIEALYSSHFTRDDLLIRISDWFNSSTNIDDLVTTYPDIYQLKQNFPNPFNPSTTIEYNLPEKANVKLEVFSLTGQKIISLVNKLQSKGQHSVTFNAGNLASGIYFYKLETKQFTKIKRMILIQ